MEVFVM